MPPTRELDISGPHTREVLNAIRSEMRNQDALDSILRKAKELIIRSVDPSAGPPEHQSDGLLYGLIQSGKTSIIIVAAALAADNGFSCILILTSDIDLLYNQTLGRIRRALRGIPILGKNDWRDSTRFSRQLRTPPVVLVCSKNGNRLGSLLDAMRTARTRNLSTLIIDDEADQASLNTFTSRGGDQTSRINQVITEFRGYFPINTYIQVTATPQALFLQRPDHQFRPSFTVLSDPGPNYVGGESFFSEESNLLRIVDLEEVNQLRASFQPRPTDTIPIGLRKALLTFFVGATAKILLNQDQSYAFLCHVSVNQRDHQHIINLIDRFREDTLNTLRRQTGQTYERLINDLREAYADLSQTEPTLPPFFSITEQIAFYLHGANIRLVNALSNEEISLDAAYNIFVGGNKLGRGVTIKNLLVSYYGRNPQRPNSDTVLQHARMYGYRQGELGVTRLFLPDRLAQHFRLIHQMENALRGLVSGHPEGHFEGIFISPPLQATRSNVLDPNSIGVYVAGGYCNPAYPLRSPAMNTNTQWIDDRVQTYSDHTDYYETNIGFILEILDKCFHDPQFGAELWDKKTIRAALEKTGLLFGERAYIRIRRDRALEQDRRETQGFLSGGEDLLVPRDETTLFLYRLRESNKGIAVWWPLIRFRAGNFVLAFSFNR